MQRVDLQCWPLAVAHGHASERLEARSTLRTQNFENGFREQGFGQVKPEKEMFAEKTGDGTFWSQKVVRVVGRGSRESKHVLTILELTMSLERPESCWTLFLMPLATFLSNKISHTEAISRMIESSCDLYI